MSKSTELMDVQAQETAVALPAWSKDDLMAELDELGTMSFEKIKIPSGGGIAFEVPGENPDDPDMVKALEGVIVHHHPKNVYYRDAYTGASEDGNRPDCESVDGKTGVMSESGAERNCQACRYNKFGSGKDGIGKACQNRVDLYIMLAGEMFPRVLSLPATSVKDFKSYLAMRVVAKKQRLCQVITRITLKKAVSKSGIQYSTCSFQKLGDVDPGALPEILERKEMCRNVALTRNAPADETMDYEEVTGADEELPY